MITHKGKRVDELMGDNRKAIESHAHYHAANLDYHRAAVKICPAYSLEPCPIPRPGESMHKIGLANHASELQTMLRICNSDKSEPRNWSAQPSPDTDSS